MRYIPPHFRGSTEWRNDPEGATARLVRALRCSEYEEILPALEEGADICAAGPFYGLTALHHLAARATPDSLRAFNPYRPSRHLLLDVFGRLPSRVGVDSGNLGAAHKFYTAEVAEAERLGIPYDRLSRAYLYAKAEEDIRLGFPPRVPPKEKFNVLMREIEEGLARPRNAAKPSDPAPGG
jgi:hypothetical protein